MTYIVKVDEKGNLLLTVIIHEHVIIMVHFRTMKITVLNFQTGSSFALEKYTIAEIWLPFKGWNNID